MNRIKELRKSKGVSQTELANALKVSQQTISSYENGTRDPDPETLTAISKYFNVSVGYLLGETNIPHRYEDADKFLSKLKKELNNRGFDFDDKSAEELAEILSITLKLMDKTKSN